MGILTSLFKKVQAVTHSDKDHAARHGAEMRIRLGPVDGYMAILLAQASVIREAKAMGGLEKWSILRYTGVDTSSSMAPENREFFGMNNDLVFVKFDRFCFDEAARLRQQAKAQDGRDVCSLAADGLELIGYGFRSAIPHSISGVTTWTPEFRYIYQPLVIHQAEDVELRIDEIFDEAEELGLDLTDEIWTAWNARRIHFFCH